MIAPGQTMEEYMAEIEAMDHVAYHAARKKEIVEQMLKSGWCLTNHHHQCPVEFVTVDKCKCPCHEGMTAEDIAARRRPELVSKSFPAPQPLKLKKRKKAKSNARAQKKTSGQSESAS